MKLSHATVRVAPLVLSCCFSGTLVGQDYPNKPVRIVAIGPGGTVDLGARLVAQGLSGPLGQQVIVDNRPSGVIPGEIVAKSAPDGYTLLVSGGTLWVTSLFQDNVPYDPIKDFSPISIIYRVPQLMVVHPTLPAKSVTEFIALAKARPGAINYSSSGPGSSSHLAGAMLAYMAKINIVSVPFRNAGLRSVSLLSGEVQLEFGTGAGVVSTVKAGKLRLLAITTAQPSRLFPGVPTVAATVPGYEAVSTGGFFAPAKTPPDLLRRLNQEVVRALNRPEIQDKFMAAGAEAVGSTPEELGNHIKSEMTRLATVIKAAGIRAQ